MILQSQKCRVEITIDKTYTVDSADNRHYDVTLNPDYYQRSDMSKTLSVFIDLFTAQLNIALIGSFYTYDSDCAVLDGDGLTILQNDIITQINVTDGSIVRHIRLDSFGCNFAIYKVEKGYIIYGEMEVTMLDFDFNKKWAFSGKDIFASVSRENSFELLEKSIHLWDFEDNEYEIDFEGRLIK